MDQYVRITPLLPLKPLMTDSPREKDVVLKPEILRAIIESGVDQASPIFRQLVETMLSGEDCVLQAPIYFRTINAALTGILQIVSSQPP